MVSNKSIKEGMNALLEQTNTLDFPFFANKNKKRKLILEKKSQIDRSIDQLIGDSGIVINEKQRELIWKEAETDARSEFASLPEEHLLNGFYYQELMHRYVKQVFNVIIEKLGGA